MPPHDTGPPLRTENISTVRKPTKEFLAHLRAMGTGELRAFTNTLSTLDFRRLTELDVAEIGHFIRTDGCTGTFNFYLRCCIIHDWWYRTHRNLNGSLVTKLEADRGMRDCIMAHSMWGHWNPIAHWRYWAVREFGTKAWE